jgi:membrane protease YdiL (CAAX protease family)
MSTVHRRILLFFLVTYALSWFGWLGNWVVPSDNWPEMNPLGPLIAAPLVIWFTEGGAGVAAWWRRILHFRAPLSVYAVAFLIPLAIILAAIGLAAATGAATRPLPERGLAEFLILVPVMLLLGPAPEELSFRGYGQHEMQTAITPLSAALWIGIGVLIWHTPLFLSGSVPWPFIVTIVAVSVVYAWLYRRGGSLWPLVTLHFVVNYFGGEWLGEIIAEGQVLYAIYYAVFYVLWAGFIVWRFGPELGRRPLHAEPTGWRAA